MNKIQNFINENKLIVLIIVLIFLLLVIWVFVLPHIRKKESFSDDDSVKIMNGLVGKNVYITTDVGGLKHYLSISSASDCLGASNGCQMNVPVFKNEKTHYATFRIGKHPNQNKYTIQNLNQNHDLPNLHIGNQPDKLCFDNNQNPEVIYFEVVSVDSGILLNFKRNDKDNWVGICAGSDAKCENDIRVCLFHDRHLAVPFRFEMTTPHVESFDDIPSIYSNDSFYSSKTLMSSLPGAACSNCQIYQNL
ncbi:hypothetical protein Indivirus_1_199 [Indivirus ILV1]|uniref:Uncharacterized protein n=1 Tax=Indivirus ILV1 TaxID=1977633 RepID=A0A1V0SCY6_9VIRU|nr:hypothetical protein Indivirus_1_199 [Indivirus ILV1]